MKKIVILLSAAATACAALASSEPWRHGERQPLWPEGKIPHFQEQQIGAMTDEASTNAAWRAAHQMPYLEWFEPPTSNLTHGCMILVSGGGYGCLCDLHLIKEWKERFTALGFQCVNLVYRSPRPQGLPVWQSAWEDGQRAVRLVRKAAAQRGFEPGKIGAIGMSAGAHLVCLLAANSLTPAYAPVDGLDDIPCNINWAIANAPAYNTLNGVDGGQTVKDGVSVVPHLNPCLLFDANTCPISFHHGGADPWTPNGSTLAYRELRKRNIPAELHLYADRPHGAWGFERALEFMRQMNYDGRRTGDDQWIEHRWLPGDTARTEKQKLWPDGQVPDRTEDQKFDPYLVWFVPEKPTTKAIQMITPGGGYGFCNFNGEGTPVAHYLNGKGMTTVVVMYRYPRPAGRPKHFSALQDTQRAIRLVRAEAPKRGLDPDRIGLMGFSAGGHVALVAATGSQTPAYAPVDGTDELSCKVQWACPIYPSYILTDGITAIPNRTRGNDDSAVLVDELKFDADTPPMCFVHGDEDVVSAMGSVKCWEKLRTMGVQCDLHTLAKCGHCFQLRTWEGTGAYTWLDQIWDFMTRKGFNK